MASGAEYSATEEREALIALLKWPNVRRMMRTVCDLDEACGPATHGSQEHAHKALLANAPPEAKKILRHLGQCVGTANRQRASAFQMWMQENQTWERGRRFLGVPDICLPQPVPPYIDFNQELAATSPALYDMYVQDLLRLLSYGSSVTTDPDPYLDLFRWTDAASATAWVPQQQQEQQQQEQHQQQEGGGNEANPAFGNEETSGGGGEEKTLGTGTSSSQRASAGESSCTGAARNADPWVSEAGAVAPPPGACGSPESAGSSVGAAGFTCYSPSSLVLAYPGIFASSSSTLTSASASAVGSSSRPSITSSPDSPASAAATPSTAPKGRLSQRQQQQSPKPRSGREGAAGASAKLPPPPLARGAAAAVLPAAAIQPAAPPFGSSGAAAAARVSREVPGLGLVPERLFLRAPAESQRLRALPHGHPLDWPSRLSPVLQWAHPALPWFTPSRGYGLVMAGGAALSMAVPGAAATDVDLFLVVPSLDPATGLRRTEAERKAAAWLLVREAMEAVQRQVAVHDRSLWVYAVAGSNLHTLDVMVTDKGMDGSADGGNLVAQLQLVLRLYESPAQVVHGFDVDACTVLYDGVELWAAGRALRALHCGFMLMEPVRQSPSYEIRLHKYSKRLGMDILIPGLDPMLLEPAVQELDAMQTELTSRLAERLGKPWIRTDRDREWSTSMFHRFTRVPTVRRLAGRSSGLARLLLVQRLGALGVTPEEAKLLTTGYKQRNMNAADAAVNRGQVYHTATLFDPNAPMACAFLGRSLLLEDSMWSRLKQLTNFQVNAVHLQVGREALFSGSFTHTPFDDWYRCCLSKLEERLLRGELDWEARARERVVQEHDAIALASASDAERRLEAKCSMYQGLLAALRAGRPDGGGGGSAAAATGVGLAALITMAEALTGAAGVNGTPGNGTSALAAEAQVMWWELQLLQQQQQMDGRTDPEPPPPLPQQQQQEEMEPPAPQSPRPPPPQRQEAAVPPVAALTLQPPAALLQVPQPGPELGLAAPTEGVAELLLPLSPADEAFLRWAAEVCRSPLQQQQHGASFQGELAAPQLAGGQQQPQQTQQQEQQQEQQGQLTSEQLTERTQQQEEQRRMQTAAEAPQEAQGPQLPQQQQQHSQPPQQQQALAPASPPPQQQPQQPPPQQLLRQQSGLPDVPQQQLPAQYLGAGADPWDAAAPYAAAAAAASGGHLGPRGPLLINGIPLDSYSLATALRDASPSAVLAPPVTMLTSAAAATLTSVLTALTPPPPPAAACLHSTQLPPVAAGVLSASAPPMFADAAGGGGGARGDFGAPLALTPPTMTRMAGPSGAARPVAPLERSVAGSPGLAVGWRCCVRTGDLLHQGQRYRLVASAAAGVAAAEEEGGAWAAGAARAGELQYLGRRYRLVGAEAEEDDAAVGTLERRAPAVVAALMDSTAVASASLQASRDGDIKEAAAVGEAPPPPAPTAPRPEMASGLSAGNSSVSTPKTNASANGQDAVTRDTDVVVDGDGGDCVRTRVRPVTADPWVTAAVCAVAVALAGGRELAVFVVVAARLACVGLLGAAVAAVDRGLKVEELRGMGSVCLVVLAGLGCGLLLAGRQGRAAAALGGA